MSPNLLLTRFASGICAQHASNLLKFPNWYEYLPSSTQNVCTPSLNNLSDVWLIVAAVIEILLRVAAILAVAFVIYGGTRYISSQGDPNQTAHAQSTVIAAVVGLVICVIATFVVTFIAGSIN